MPATESTWRDPKRLHQVFAISCLLMLAATIWMFVEDHSREWKPYQIKTNAIEDQVTAWRQLQFITDENAKKHEQLERELQSAQAQPIDMQAYSAFKEAVASDPEARESSFDSLDALVENANKLALEAAEKRKAYNAVREQANQIDQSIAKSVADLDKAKAAVAAAPNRIDAEKAVSQAQNALDTFRKNAEEARKSEAAADEVARNAESASSASRANVLTRLGDIIVRAKFREDSLLSTRKFRSADRDKYTADLGLLVRDAKGRTEEERARESRSQEQVQITIDLLSTEIAELTLKYQAAVDHRKALQGHLATLTDQEEIARKAAEKNREESRQLDKATEDRRSTYFVWLGPIPVPGKKWLELPILDAFNSPRKIDNLWSSGLTIDYNSSRVRRFDRCTTCHRSMEKSLPGEADKEAYPHERLIELTLIPPTKEQLSSLDANASTTSKLESALGLRLAEEGLLNPNDVTVSYVRPASPGSQARPTVQDEFRQPRNAEDLRAAMMQPVMAPRLGVAGGADYAPGLQLGDVIARINGDPIYNSSKAAAWLYDAAQRGEILRLTVRRGLPHPYASHPRLDLYVGSLSPHKVSVFACTICHDGQGSATAFKWTSHTPSTLQQKSEWAREHGWFDNEHWIFPMYSRRFAESTCLKCHHDVVDLEPSARFPDPPAPKVTRGYDLIRKYGCYGCHEINGFDGPARRIGPDMRLEPNFFAAAQQLRADPGATKLTQDETDWIEQLIASPDRDSVRRRLYESLVKDQNGTERRFSGEAYNNLIPLLRDVESPGQLRKPGPSLRHTAKKLDPEFLYDWIRDPKRFRPNTRMPRFFGLWNHLHNSGLHVAEELEPVEILGIATYLQSRSQPFEFIEPPAGIRPSTTAEKIARGKTLFQTRGCLACHSHKEFGEAERIRDANSIVQGPDLSGVGDKFSPARNPNGRRWLYSWIKQPTRYHPRTVMPDTFLNPIPDAEGKLTDPADDIVEYLLAHSNTGWQPGEKTLTKPDKLDEQALNRLTRDHLRDAFFEKKADQYLVSGIPSSMRRELKGAETEMVIPENYNSDPNFRVSSEQKLKYIGRKSIAKYGCYGCHDIPGFEDAKPIGTGLADWGRKDPSRLAFEHITHYLKESEHGHSANHHQNGSAHTHQNQSELDPYFEEQIQSGNRIGFIYQKLREPRSYDYHKTENKKYNDRLRMPEFPFDADEREAIITFVLGLVADPPAEKFIYQPNDRSRAIIAGRQALEKFNCAGCHVLEAERWSLGLASGKIPEQPEGKVYPFLKSHFPPEQLASSARLDRRGMVETTLHGMPVLADNGRPLAYDSFGDPIEDGTTYDPTTLEYPIDLWRPAAIDGRVFETGVMAINAPAVNLQSKTPSEGGFLAKYLLPHVVALEKQINAAAKGTEAWGWLPPPLIGQGKKVQSDWFHAFLLDPYPIRPATFLRMPKFNMSPAEATAIVNYFSAIDNAESPYQFADRKRPQHLLHQDAKYRETLAKNGRSDEPVGVRLNDAMKIVVDNNYCVKCHLVGDFQPKGSDRAKAPNLADVHRRLRPDYVRNWVANPKSVLPYTSMPVNILYDPESPTLGGVNQQLFHGTSVEQLDGLVDLLMNFDEFSKVNTKVSGMVKDLPATPPADGAKAAGD